MKDKLNKIYNFYSEVNQAEKLAEECFEYLEACDNFFKEPTTENLKAMYSEIADLHVLSTQFKQNVDYVNEQVEFKVDREIGRILKTKG